jgi:hypothetical protein
MLSRPVDAVNRRPSAANLRCEPLMILATGKFVASRTGEAYDARDSGSIENFGLLARRTARVARKRRSEGDR